LFHAIIVSILDVLYAIICHYISFFGTNLLTQCPVPVVVFCLFFTSQNISTKWSPNAVKLVGDFFGPEDNLGAKEAPGERPVGPMIHQGAPEALGVP
jgi:hypothetical protein